MAVSGWRDALELSDRSKHLGLLAYWLRERQRGRAHGGRSRLDGLAGCTVHGICGAVRSGGDHTRLDSATVPGVRASPRFEPLVISLPHDTSKNLPCRPAQWAL